MSQGLETRSVPWGHFLLSCGTRVDAPLSDIEGFHFAKIFSLKEFPLKTKSFKLFWSSNDRDTPGTVIKREGRIVDFVVEKLKRDIPYGSTAYYPASLLAVADSKTALDDLVEKKRVRIPSLKNLAMAKSSKKSGKQEKKAVGKTAQTALKKQAKLHNITKVLSFNSQEVKGSQCEVSSVQDIGEVQLSQTVDKPVDCDVQKRRDKAKLLNVSKILDEDKVVQVKDKDEPPKKKAKQSTGDKATLSDEATTTTEDEDSSCSMFGGGSSATSDVPQSVFQEVKTEFVLFKKKYQSLLKQNDDLEEEKKVLIKERDYFKKKFEDSKVDLEKLKTKYSKVLELNISLQLGNLTKDDVQPEMNSSVIMPMVASSSSKPNTNLDLMPVGAGSSIKPNATLEKPSYSSLAHGVNKHVVKKASSLPTTPLNVPTTKKVKETSALSPTNKTSSLNDESLYVGLESFDHGSVELEGETSPFLKGNTTSVKTKTDGSPNASKDSLSPNPQEDSLSPEMIRARMKRQSFAASEKQIDTLLDLYKKKVGPNHDSKFIKKGCGLLWSKKELWNRSATGTQCPNNKNYDPRPECTPEKKEYLTDLLRLKIFAERKGGTVDSEELKKRAGNVSKYISSKVSYIRRGPEPADDETADD